MRLLKLDKVNLLGALFGTLSLCFCSFLIYRPHRLAAGTPHYFVDIASWPESLWMAALWIAAVVASFIAREKRPFIQLLVATTLTLSLFWMIGAHSSRLFEAAPSYARISLGLGSWLMFTAAFVLFLNLLEFLRRSPVITCLCVVSLCLGLTVIWMHGHLNHLSIVIEFYNKKERFMDELVAHLTLAFSAVGIGALLGIPLGVLAFKRKTLGAPILTIFNIVQTIPSLALFGLLVTPLAYLSLQVEFLHDVGVEGIGWAPALIALVLYALLPIIRNTHAGLGSLDKGIIEAGVGMGMSRLRLLFTVELPMIRHIILNGVRIAAVQSIGNTAVAALIGAGGFGIFIFQGLGQAATDLILLGTLPIILLAVVTDFLMQAITFLAKAEALK